MAILIGVTCDFEVVQDRRGAAAPRYICPDAYVRALGAAGALAVLLPHQDPAAPEELLAPLAGLVISGGDFDVPPSYYGQAPRPRLGKLLDARSSFERSLLQQAMARKMPILGVCGGMQLLNVACGGTLFQDLSERPHTASHEQPAQKHLPHHAVRLTPGSQLARIYGTELLQANSTHHQIVDRVGEPLRATGTTEDGVVEAIEHTALPFCLGVQWHPELLGGQAWRLYAALVAAATTTAGTRGEAS